MPSASPIHANWANFPAVVLNAYFPATLNSQAIEEYVMGSEKDALVVPAFSGGGGILFLQAVPGGWGTPWP